MEFDAKVISGNRITIPNVVWETLGIEDGDLVHVQLWKVKRGKEAK